MTSGVDSKGPRKAHLSPLLRTPALVFALLLVGLTALMAATRHMIASDRDEVIARFSAERVEKLEEAVSAVEEDFADVFDDLRFAGRLIADATNVAERRRELGAMLGSGRLYHAIGVYDEDADLYLMVTDPRRSVPVPHGYKDSMGDTARQSAMNQQSGRIEISPSLEDDVEGWYRIFATPVPEGPRPSAGKYIAILVDTQPVLDRLRLLASDPGSEFLVLGPFGSPAGQSSPRVARLVENMPRAEAATGLEKVVHKMELGEQGNMRLTHQEADALGLGEGDVVAVYAPIRLEGGIYWSVATFTSMSALESHELAIMWRLGVVSAVIALCLIAFALYVVVSSWRSAALLDRLAHADELARLREKAEKILENIPTGVMLLAEGGTVTSVNRALAKRVPESALGASLEKALPSASPEAVGRLNALLARTNESKQPESLHFERLELFGGDGDYNVHAVPLQPHAPDAHTLIVVEDLTELRALESQLLQAEKLATVGILAAGIAHEIGTPLGVMRGRAEQVIKKLGEDHPATAACKIIIEQSDRVTRTIRALLDFSRVQPASVQPVSVDSTVKKTAELLRYELERRHLSLETELPPNLPPIAANADQLQQVLLNLVLNAFDASTPGGKIQVVAHPAERRGASEIIQLEVVDFGCGIPEENRHRVFDPFFTTKKRGQGTGLGLTIVSQIVRSHGAQLELDSEEGRGTRAILLWPVAPPNAQGSSSELRHAI